MTIKEAAMELDVLPETVRKYLRLGTLGGRKVPGTIVRVRAGKSERVQRLTWLVNGRSVRGFLRQRGG